MKTEKRILIVEDHPGVLETYTKNVSRAGFIVDTATNKEEALEKVRRRTYHVAMIDVNLTDFSGGDGNDRSGIDVVKNIHAQGEGTKCIVISGEKSSEVPVDAHDAGIDKYIIKKRIRVPDDYVGPLKQLAQQCVIRSSGRFGDLIAYLSFPEKRWAWEDQIMRVIKTDAAGLERILTEVLSPFLPVLRQNRSSHSFGTSVEFNRIGGAFWSKAAACPIWVSIGQKGAQLAPPDDIKKAEVLSSRTKGSPQFVVWGVDNMKRSQFVGRTDEVGPA